MTLDELGKVFKLPSQTKTLKTVPVAGYRLLEVVGHAYDYLHSNEAPEYNRIEFKYNDCYIVVAKLKK